MHQSSRVVGPSLSPAAPLTDDSYAVYGLHYRDYLDRIAVRGGSRPYITPPQFPQGKAVTTVSMQFHRRLYAMYMDTATKQLPDPSIAGYCYLLVFSQDVRSQVAGSLGPYPKIRDLKSALSKHGFSTSVFCTLQFDGTYHFSQDSSGSSCVNVIRLSMLDEFEQDSRVGGLDVHQFRQFFNDKPFAQLHQVDPNVFDFGNKSLQLVDGFNTVVCSDMQTTGDWTGLVKIKGGDVVILAPGQFLDYFGTVIGSDTHTVYVHASVTVILRVRSHVVVEPERVREFLGPGVAWSSELSKHFASSAPTLSVRVKTFGWIQLVSASSPDFMFSDESPLIISGKVGTAEYLERCATVDRITDPLDDWTPVYESRYTVAPLTTRSLVFRSSGYPNAIRFHTPRSEQESLFDLSGFVRLTESEANVAMLGAGYLILRSPAGISQRGASIHIIVPENDYSYDCHYGID